MNIAILDAVLLLKCCNFVFYICVKKLNLPNNNIWSRFNNKLITIKANLLNNNSKHKPIPNTGFSNEVAGAGGILLQFLSQMSHINTQIMTVFDRVWPPHLVKELALGEHFPGVIQQHRQQAELNRGEMHLFLTAMDHTSC